MNNIKIRSTIALFTFSLFIITCYGQAKGIKKHYAQSQNSGKTAKFISINLNDSSYIDFKSFAVDTITDSGWRIKYLVKNDSTKYKDIYIDCFKGNKHAIYFGSDLLQLRPGFVPRYIAETKSHLVFWHRCATDCQALLVLSKDASMKFKEFESVIDYNLNLGQILYISDDYYENPSNNFIVNLMDLVRNKNYKISFKEVCSAANMVSCVDTVIFKKSKVTVKAILRPTITANENKIISKTIKL